MSDISITGIKEVESAMKALAGFPEQRQLLQAANRRAARPYVKAAKANVPVGNGDLKKSIGVKSARRTNTIVAGPRESKKWRGFTGKFFEDGTAPRSTKSQLWKGTTFRGRITPTRPFSRAWGSVKVQVRDLQIQYIKQLFDKYATKALNRR